MNEHACGPCRIWRSRLSIAVALLLALGTAGLAGCSDLGPNDKAEALDLSVRLYLHSLRWHQYSKAVRLLRHRDGTTPKVDLAGLKDLHVADYQYELDAVPGHTDEMLMTASFRYYFEDNLAVHDVRQKAMWWYDADAQQWYLDGTLPKFKD